MRQLNVGLTDEQRAKRCNSIGGSDANIIMSGDDEAILRLWEEKTGQREPEDLSGILPVIMGSWTEELNRYWYERQTGNIICNEGQEVSLAEKPWMTCTLDGLVCEEVDGPSNAIFEAKHVSAFQNEDGIVQKYMPQLHHNMAVNCLNHAILSVFFGTQKWECYEVEADPFYMETLLEREALFWQAVTDKTPPVHMPAVEPPAPPETWRTVDMSTSNEWASFAADWLENKQPAAVFKKAEKGLKELVEADVGLAAGHAVQVKRSKNNALRISEMK